LRAKEAERLGYESVWVTQMPDARDVVVPLAACAATQWCARHRRPAHLATRHPTAMAQMAARWTSCRRVVILGIGVSHKATVEGMGPEAEHPAEAMRQYLSIVRDSLANGSVRRRRALQRALVLPGPRRSTPPIMIRR
jgi:alkanesulfonate monooxygenase SsuD/methylene tetrahydromethanopterin reductase-like flavin-dependent oxidoreductase (luciferase family)